MVVANPSAVLFATAFLVAAVGMIVASIAYRGYQRNDSDSMRFLAVGVACITVGPFVISYGVSLLVEFSDAAALLGVLLANVIGLLAILYSLEAT
jgi:CHASE2 domain-containing sensor protein